MATSMAIRLPGSPAARRGLPLLLLGLLFACTPGASPGRLLHSSNPNPFCTSRHYLPPASLCFFFEGDPLPGQPFTLTIDAFYGAHPKEPPYTLTLILPAALEVLNLDTSRPYTLHSSIPVSLLDPTQPILAGRGAFTATGTLIAVDLGRIGQQSLWDPGERRERPGERVRLTLRLSEAGEWQVWGLLHQGELVVRLEWGLLGWSTPSQAYWTDHETAYVRYSQLHARQCLGNLSCTPRFPYDPYRYLIGAPADASGHSLRIRPSVFCQRYDRPGPCADYGQPQWDPEAQTQKEPCPLWQPNAPCPAPTVPLPTPTPSPSTSIPLTLHGRITFVDPQRSIEQPARGVRIEVWDRTFPEECPPPTPPIPPLPLSRSIYRPMHPSETPSSSPDRRGIPYPCRDRRLARLYTSLDNASSGAYTITLLTDGTVDPYLRIYATDDQRVTVFQPDFFAQLYVHETPPIGKDLSGEIPFNVVIPQEKSIPFFIYDTLTRLGWEGLQREVGWSPRERLNVYWPGPCVFGQIGGSCYFYNGIRLTEPDGRSPDAILHEFGHFVLSRFHGDDPIILACAPTFEHALPQHTSLHCAWSEGWASFLGVALKGWNPNSDLWIENPFGFPDFPRPDPVDPHATNADNEWATAAALWDLFDHLPEPWDPHADGWDGPARNGIWTLSTQRGFNLDFGIEEFWLKWVERRPDRLGEAACPMYRLQILLAADPSVSPIPYGLCPPGWSAAFFQDQDDGRWTLNGPITWPTFTALVTQTTWPAIAFNTHSAPNQPVPGLQGTFWSARFSGWLLVPQPASLRFFFDRLDDGGRLLLNDTRVFESWIVHGPRDETVEPFLPAGLIPITVEYAQGPAYEASLFLNWEGPGWAKELLGPIRLLGADIAPTPTPAGWDRILPLGPDRRTPPPRPTGTPSP